MEKQPRIRKDGQPYGSPKIRMSKRAELDAFNGKDLKQLITPSNDKDEPNDAVNKEKEIDMESNETFDVPAIVNEENKLIVLPPAPERKIELMVSLDQKGIKDSEGQLVDPDGNTFKEIRVEITGKVMDIAKIAGRVANDLHDFYLSLAGVKGIKRGLGFNVNMEMKDESIGEESTIKIKSVSKVRMSNPINIAFAIGSAILTQVEEDNADSLMTGDFKVSKDGELLMKKLKFSEKMLNLPIHVVKQKLNEARLRINKNVKENKAAVK